MYDLVEALRNGEELSGEHVDNVRNAFNSVQYVLEEQIAPLQAPSRGIRA